MYSTVSFIILLFPSNMLIFIPWMPTLLLSASLCSSNSSQLNRKWSAVSFPASHSHMGLAMILKQCRYPFRWQCPVHSREIHTTCFRCCNVPYSLGPIVTSGCWLILRMRLAWTFRSSSERLFSRAPPTHDGDPLKSTLSHASVLSRPSTLSHAFMLCHDFTLPHASRWLRIYQVLT